MNNYCFIFLEGTIKDNKSNKYFGGGFTRTYIKRPLTSTESSKSRPREISLFNLYSEMNRKESNII